MRAAFLLCLLLLTLQARAAFDVFLEVTPLSGPVIAGGSVDPLYAGWIEALSFEAGADTPVTLGPVPTIGRVGFREFALVKKVGPSTPTLFSALASGQILATVKMVVVLRTPLRVELWDIKATTCVAKQQSFSGESFGEMQERISFLMGAFEWSYIQLGPSGDPIAERYANWSVIDNAGTVNALTRPPSYLGAADTDGDGIPDGWETFYGLNHQASDSALDTDGDGLDNLREFIAHTDPRAPQSVLRVTAFQPNTPGNYLLTWKSVAGLNYRIFTATAPGGPFSFLKNVPSAGNGTTSTTVAGPAGQFFYRVVTP